ncbi:hypothetical protein P4V47_13500 [Brevibacillus laterosporus]|uniref:hypothetical protein n=1 Tax=Brevibacillus laterosporus TaxID=1465 RepID=UPI002E1FFDF9|nr:hypothetical protein [Brevibacillus laterosporus]
MDRDLSTLVDLVEEAYPNIPIISQLGEWMKGTFQLPSAFVMTQTITEKGNSLTSYKVICEATIMLHYPLEQEKHVPLSIAVLRDLLRKQRYSYRSKNKLLLDIDPSTFTVNTEKKERAEITFRYEYLMPVRREQVDKITIFDVKEDGHG